MDKKNKYYYVVKRGFKEGIFTTWEECKNCTQGFKNPIFRKFNTIEEAQQFLEGTDFKITNKKHEEIEKKPEKKTNYSTDKYLSKYKGYIKSDNFDLENSYNVNNWNVFNDEYFIFTDGSFKKRPEKSIAGLGVFLGVKSNNIKEIYTDRTNNQCELDSVNMVFKIILNNANDLIKKRKKINIVSDSEYTINCVTKWLKKWKSNNWLTANGHPVKNKEIIESIDELMYKLKVINSELDNVNKIKIKFIHVNSHQKPSDTDKYQNFLWQGNLIADALAQNKL